MLANVHMKYFNKEIFSYIDKIHRQKQNRQKPSPNQDLYSRMSRVYFNNLIQLKSKNNQKIPSEVKRKYYPGVLRVLAIFSPLSTIPSLLNHYFKF